MAIIVEERTQGSTGLITVAIWLVLLASVAIGVYYVFFRSPEILDVAGPSGFQTVEQIASINLDPAGVLDDPKFRSLQSHRPQTEAKTSGRANPFLGVDFK